MTLEEKKIKLREYCLGRENCCECPLLHTEEHCWDCDTSVDRNYEIIFGKKPDTGVKEDVVNHPKHYCREGAIESIEEMVLVFGKEAVKHFCLCNIWKYRYRASSKNGEEDLNKSDWYMKKYKELCEDGETGETGEKQIHLPV